MLHYYDNTNQMSTHVQEITHVQESTDNKIFDYDDVIVNLKLIGQLREDDRLRIHDNILDIENRFGQSLFRMVSGDSRTSTLIYIINLINSAQFHSSQLVNEIEHIVDKNDKYQKNLRHKLYNLTVDLNSCLNGLDKLKITYKNDHVFRSKIEIICDQIRTTTENNMDQNSQITYNHQINI